MSIKSWFTKKARKTAKKAADSIARTIESNYQLKSGIKTKIQNAIQSSYSTLESSIDALAHVTQEVKKSTETIANSITEQYRSNAPTHEAHIAENITASGLESYVADSMNDLSIQRKQVEKVVSQIERELGDHSMDVKVRTSRILADYISYQRTKSTAQSIKNKVFRTNSLESYINKHTESFQTGSELDQKKASMIATTCKELLGYSELVSNDRTDKSEITSVLHNMFNEIEDPRVIEEPKVEKDPALNYNYQNVNSAKPQTLSGMLTNNNYSPKERGEYVLEVARQSLTQKLREQHSAPISVYVAENLEDKNIHWSDRYHTHRTAKKLDKKCKKETVGMSVMQAADHIQKIVAQYGQQQRGVGYQRKVLLSRLNPLQYIPSCKQKMFPKTQPLNRPQYSN